MSSLQIGLFIAGVLLVIGVIVYNRWQERRMRARLGATRLDPEASPQRVEPTLRRDDDDDSLASPVGAVPSTPADAETDVAHDPDWRPPMDGVVTLPEHGG